MAGVYVFLFGAGGMAALGLWAIFRNRNVYKVPRKFPAEWRTLLEMHVRFYQNLDSKGKRRYEKKVSRFLRKVRITGIRVEVDDLDRMLTASSAVIPLFNFPEWRYSHLHEVLLYPSHFDKDFSTKNPKEVITGMVGSGRNMDGVMILNKDSLHLGFSNATNKKNVGIHEFAHLIDKEDGAIDGVPPALNEPKAKKRWLKLVKKITRLIKKGKSDINPYAATSKEEFLAVASEYFFERPELLQQKHPDLYRMLTKVYKINMVKRLTKPFKKKSRIGRNDPCPCGSGEKYKQCCLK